MTPLALALITLLWSKKTVLAQGCADQTKQRFDAAITEMRLRYSQGQSPSYPYALRNTYLNALDHADKVRAQTYIMAASTGLSTVLFLLGWVP